jgi:hypothetical protein
MRHIEEFYARNPGIPPARRPDVVHVIGKYLILKSRPGFNTRVNQLTGLKTEVPLGEYMLLTGKPDVQGLCVVVEGLQWKAALSTHILFSYWEVNNRAAGLP